MEFPTATHFSEPNTTPPQYFTWEDYDEVTDKLNALDREQAALNGIRAQGGRRSQRRSRRKRTSGCKKRSSVSRSRAKK